MPKMRHWPLRPPDMWANQDFIDYVTDTTATLTRSMLPVLKAIGPQQTVNILLTTIFHIAKANPVWQNNILLSMDETADEISRIKREIEAHPQ